MKIPCFSTRHLLVSLLMCFFISSCNTEEYFALVSTVEGRDAYCSEAADQNICESRSDVCQPSFEDSSNELEAPLFSACIANPIVEPEPQPEPETPAPGEGETPAPGDGGTVTPPPVVILPPTIEETYAANCTNLDSEYLWIKNITQKNQLKERVVKVKVCHQTGNLSMHTILIACPALQAHIDHHEDYIGACEL